MEFSAFIGLAAGALTTGSILPQIIKSIRLKETKDIALWTYLMSFFGVSLWIIYGVMINSMPVTIANGIALAFIITILILKKIYG